MSEIEFGNSETDTDGLPRIELAGRFLQRVDTITSTTMSLLTTVGTIEGQEKQILVPFVAVNFRGFKAFDAKQKEDFFEHIIGLENAAFLASDLVDELSSVLGQLAAVSSGNLKAGSDNLGVVLTLLGETRSRLDDCIQQVDVLRRESEASNEGAPPTEGAS